MDPKNSEVVCEMVRNRHHPFMKKFSDPKFKVDSYVSEVIAMSDIKLLQEKLQILKKYRGTINDEITNQIYNSLGKYINVNDQALALKGYALSLQDSLSSFQNALTSLSKEVKEGDASDIFSRVQSECKMEIFSVEELLHPKVGSEKWFEEIPDKITAYISESKFEDALGIVKQYKENDITNIKHAIIEKCDIAYQRLIEGIESDIASSQRSDKNIKILIDLGLGARAIKAFLAGRSRSTKLKYEELKMIQDIRNIKEKVWQIFINEVIVTKKCFENWAKENPSIKCYNSYITKWILQELKEFCEMQNDILFQATSFKNLYEFSSVARESLIKCEKIENKGIFIRNEFQRLMAESYKSKVEIIMKETFSEKQMMIGSNNGFLIKEFDLRTLIKKASKNENENKNENEKQEENKEDLKEDIFKENKNKNINKIELTMFCFCFIETLFELTCNIIYELLDYESLAFISYIISDHFIFIVSQNIATFCGDDFSKICQKFENEENYMSKVNLTVQGMEKALDYYHNFIAVSSSHDKLIYLTEWRMSDFSEQINEAKIELQKSINKISKLSSTEEGKAYLVI